MGAYCDVSDNQHRGPGFEGYVTAGLPLKYRIHPLFLQGAGDISLKVRQAVKSVAPVVAEM
jgi:hypothetical protein